LDSLHKPSKAGITIAQTKSDELQKLRRDLMRAKTHPGDEQKIETSSDRATMDSKDMQSDTNARGKADRELKQTNLNVDDIAQQSAYESDKQGIEHAAANSDRNKKS
jgi:hypothetical protein